VAVDRGYRQIPLEFNGSRPLDGDNPQAIMTGAQTSISSSTQFFLNAGDYVRRMVSQISSGAINAEDAAIYSPEF